MTTYTLERLAANFRPLSIEDAQNLSRRDLYHRDLKVACNWTALAFTINLLVDHPYFTVGAISFLTAAYNAPTLFQPIRPKKVRLQEEVEPRRPISRPNRYSELANKIFFVTELHLPNGWENLLKYRPTFVATLSFLPKTAFFIMDKWSYIAHQLAVVGIWMGLLNIIASLFLSSVKSFTWGLVLIGVSFVVASLERTELINKIKQSIETRLNEKLPPHIDQKVKITALARMGNRVVIEIK